MRVDPVLAWGLVATAPFFILGLAAFGPTLEDVADPCMTWGTSWESYQQGGSSAAFAPDGSPLDPACPEGRSWTTEAPGHAVFRIAWWPVFGLVAVVLALVAWARERAWPLAGAGAVLVAGALPLTISAPVFVAFLPAAAAIAAARRLPWSRSERAAFRAFGAMAAAFGVFGVVASVRSVMEHGSPALFIGTTAVLAQLALIAALAWAPQRTETTT